MTHTLRVAVCRPVREGHRHRAAWPQLLAGAPPLSQVVPQFRQLCEDWATRWMCLAWLPVAVLASAAGVFVGLDSVLRRERPRSAGLTVLALSGAVLVWSGLQALAVLGVAGVPRVPLQLAGR